jgi:hypothetical protein
MKELVILEVVCVLSRRPRVVVPSHSNPNPNIHAASPRLLVLVLRSSQGLAMVIVALVVQDAHLRPRG